ncbi:Lrp/AsnC family transcriptional regulator [Kiloniella sp. b19]|uniref:Lrp/AsnC family transcriptional regulator n=1 Tax=Kiloniella sp. GXU_MW_B19 TaxID=3141326 RepID=UPI0031DEFB3B
MPEFDEFERKILALLQENCRYSVAELAERVGLSTSPCWRRLKRLEEIGVIRGRVALLDARSIGLNASAYVRVSLIDHSAESIDRFLNFVEHQPNIVDCATITGNSDFMLKVVAEDPEDLERFMMRDLLATGLIRGSSTNFILRQIKNHSKLPLPKS